MKPKEIKNKYIHSPSSLIKESSVIGVVSGTYEATGSGGWFHSVVGATVLTTGTWVEAGNTDFAVFDCSYNSTFSLHDKKGKYISLNKQ